MEILFLLTHLSSRLSGETLAGKLKILRVFWYGASDSDLLVGPLNCSVSKQVYEHTLIGRISHFDVNLPYLFICTFYVTRLLICPNSITKPQKDITKKDNTFKHTIIRSS